MYLHFGGTRDLGLYLESDSMKDILDFKMHELV